MDQIELVESRRRRYLAQAMEAFEQRIEPHLDLHDPRVKADTREAKAILRKQFQRLSDDAIDAMKLSQDTLINAVAVDLRDRLGTSR